MKRRKESRVRMVTNTQNNGAVKKGSEGVRKVQPHWCNNTREVVGNWTVAIQLTQVHEKVHLSLWHLLVGLLRTHKETRRRREREGGSVCGVWGERVRGRQTRTHKETKKQRNKTNKKQQNEKSE